MKKLITLLPILLLLLFSSCFKGEDKAQAQQDFKQLKAKKGNGANQAATEDFHYFDVTLSLDSNGYVVVSWSQINPYPYGQTVWFDIDKSQGVDNQGNPVVGDSTVHVPFSLFLPDNNSGSWTDSTTHCTGCSGLQLNYWATGDAGTYGDVSSYFLIGSAIKTITLP